MERLPQIVDRYGPAPLPKPTTALPRTSDKIEVMAQRARAGQQLHHPEDSRWSDDDGARS
jgi:hypothetical protein